MNVLHYGLILYQPYEITRGLRDIGISADYALWDDFGYSWLMHGWDINLKMDSIKTPLIQWKQRAKLSKFITKAVAEYDVIHFHSHPTFKYSNHLFSTYNDAKLLRLLHKKVFTSFWGCDARRWQTDIEYQWSPCRRCSIYMKWYCNTCSKRSVENAKKYCNAIFSAGDLCVGTDYRWINQAINTREYTPINPNDIPEKYIIDKKPDEFVVYHSFGNSRSRPDVKGSRYIENVVSSLNNEGHKIKYIFVDEVPNQDIKYIQCQADVVIEQVCAGWYGLTAIECMSLGKPVVAYLRQDAIDRCPNKDIPIINTNPQMLKQTLSSLIEKKDTLPEIGRRSREYTTKYHDNRVVASELLKYYKGC